MNIQSEIRDYILSHDFVMLPGIGGFIAEYTKPYFDDKGEIVPPQRKIRFNPLLRNDSNVEILQVFKDNLRVSTQEVQNKYFDFLDIFDSHLETNNKFIWDGIGVFIKDRETKSVQFISYTVGDESSAQSKYESKTPVKIKTTNVVNKVGAESDLPEKLNYTTKNPPFNSEDNYKEDVHFERKTGNSLFRFLIFAVPLLVLSVALIYTVFFKPKIKKDVKEENNTEFSISPDEGVVVDTLVNERAEEREIVAPPKEHTVRVGVYKNLKDADKIATRLAEEGYPARVRPHGPLFRVFVVANSEQQALEFVEKVELITGDRPIYERH